MARLFHTGAELGHEHAEGLTLGGTSSFAFDTTTKRTGSRSFKFTTSATIYALFNFTGATAQTYYACAHVLFPAATGFPTGISGADVLQFATAGSVALCSLAIQTGGTIKLWNSAVGQIGSDSAVTLTTDTWYRLELVVRVNTGTNDDVIEGYLDGAQIGATTTTNLGTTAPGLLRFGWVEDPGTSEVVFVDDVALNDSTGANNTGLVGDQKVYALFPTADSARVNWTAGGAGTTSLFAAVDNTPPVGVLPAAGVAATAQVQDAVSAAGSAYDATMTTYTAAGVGAGDTIRAISPVVELGSSSTTGTDTITHSVVSNPAIAGTVGSCDILSGTYPTSWNRSQGVMTEAPSVTLGTAPVMRVVKDIATTRINSCCQMAMLVSVTPGVAASDVYERDVHQHAVYRM